MNEKPRCQLRPARPIPDLGIFNSMNSSSSHAPDPTGWLGRAIHNPSVWGCLLVAGSVGVNLSAEWLVNKGSAIVAEQHSLQFGQLPSGGGSHERETEPGLSYPVARSTSTSTSMAPGSHTLELGTVFSIKG